MLTRKDLLVNPELVQPIGTRKGLNNKPTDIRVDLNKLFVSDSNIDLMYNSLFIVYQQNGGKLQRAAFKKLVIEQIRKFAKSRDLNAYETAEANATGFNNYIEALTAINQDFKNECYKYFSWNTYNPFQTDVEVGPSDHRVLKKGYALMAEDHGTLELWREQFTQLLNNRFRDNNRIPVNRASQHTRHYDTSNEGLRGSSWEAQVYGYDMSNIYKNIDKYKSSEWYSMGGD